MRAYRALVSRVRMKEATLDQTLDHSPARIVLAVAAMITPALCQADTGPSKFTFAAIQEQGNNIVVIWNEASCDPRQHRVDRENCYGAKTLFEGDLASVTTKALIDNHHDDPDCKFYRYSVVDGCPEAGFTTYRLWVKDDYYSWIPLGSRSTIIEHDNDLCGTPCAPDAEADADADADEEQPAYAGDGGTGCSSTGGASSSLGVLLLCAVLSMISEHERTRR